MSTSPATPEVQARIAAIRAKEAAGTLTLEDMKEAIQLIRAGRVSAARSSDAAKRTRAKKEIKSADALLDELTGGGNG